MSQIHMTGMGLFVCVVGPGFDSTSPAFVRSRASQAVGSDDRLVPKTEWGPISGGRGCVETICADVCSIPTSCRLCLFGTPYISSPSPRHMTIPSQPTTSNDSCDRLNSNQLSQFFKLSFSLSKKHHPSI